MRKFIVTWRGSNFSDDVIEGKEKYRKSSEHGILKRFKQI